MEAPRFLEAMTRTPTGRSFTVRYRNRIHGIEHSKGQRKDPEPQYRAVYLTVSVDCGLRQISRSLVWSLLPAGRIRINRMGYNVSPESHFDQNL